MSLFDLPYWLAVSFLFVLGAIVGSFLNVCIHRIQQPPGLVAALKGLWHPPSRCPRCRTDIAWHDNIPLISWIFLRGRCRHCRMWISARYPAVELLNALLFVLIYWMEVPPDWPPSVASSCLYAADGPQAVPGLGGMSAVTFLHVRYFYHLVLIEALLVASFIDLDRREIPDASTLPAMAVGLLAALLVGRVHIVPAWSQNSNLVFSFTRLIRPDVRIDQFNDVPAWFSTYPHLHGLLVSAAGLVVAGGLTWLVRLIGFWVLRREAMGFGDVILMALIGSFLGWQASVLAFFVAPALALVLLPVQMFFDRGRYIPYGPYLSGAALLVMLAWQPIWNGAGPWAGASRVFALGPMLPLVFGVMLVLFVVTLMLVQIVKRLFGLRESPQEFIMEWTGADQNHYLAGENADPAFGRWRREQWPGQASGQGRRHFDQWRSGTNGNARPTGR
ncbi:MAG: prepilin peptidase [Planctomycetota bacterium]|nr:MAG: prepilin peptidase [Planctomycetota bacterium]REK35656.1 MAG: prepilin peptidase [Planctomycetota bacterium]